MYTRTKRLVEDHSASISETPEHIELPRFPAAYHKRSPQTVCRNRYRNSSLFGEGNN